MWHSLCAKLGVNMVSIQARQVQTSQALGKTVACELSAKAATEPTWHPGCQRQDLQLKTCACGCPACVLYMCRHRATEVAMQ